MFLLSLHILYSVLCSAYAILSVQLTELKFTANPLHTIHALTAPPPPTHTHTNPPPTPTHIGALLGWLVLKDVFGPLVYGIAFGLISGMMVFISIKELLPTARRFDTTGGPLVNGFLIAGMVVMAISLVLFLY